MPDENSNTERHTRWRRVRKPNLQDVPPRDHPSHYQKLQSREFQIRSYTQSLLHVTRTELLDLAEALENAGGSGEICPDCDDGIVRKFHNGTLYHFRCSRCSVPSGELLECDECGGTGQTMTCEQMDFQREIPCPNCHGRGKVRAQVALCVVYDEASSL